MAAVAVGRRIVVHIAVNHKDVLFRVFRIRFGAPDRDERGPARDVDADITPPSPWRNRARSDMMPR